MAKQNGHQLNRDIEQFILLQDSRQMPYSPEQIAYINQYTGSGGLASQGATGQGVLYEFYTPDYIVELMWELARYYGFSGGTVLEPSIATGRLLKPATDYSQCIGFEVNPVSARIAELTYPGSHIHRGYFETAFLMPPRFTRRVGGKIPTWLEQYPFDLVIGNPPYGIYQNEYSAYFPEAKQQGLRQMEIFFIAKGLELLKSGGLLVYITSSNFMRNGTGYQTAKQYMQTLCVLKDAYRLPPVFDRSQVPTDILVFQRT